MYRRAPISGHSVFELIVRPKIFSEVLKTLTRRHFISTTKIIKHKSFDNGPMTGPGDPETLSLTLVSHSFVHQSEIAQNE